MRPSRILPLALALALVAAALTTAPAHATSATCRGAAATTVGTPGGTVTGTSGDDVVVTAGATDVDSGAGDDVICVTATPDKRRVWVDAGKGADVVDTTATAARTLTELGIGSDELYGGPGPDFVQAGEEGTYDRDTDWIRTGAGHDTVLTGNRGYIDTDDVDLGTGPGSIMLSSEWATGDLRAAAGYHATIDLEPRTAGDWMVDDRADRMTVDGEQAVAWTNLDVFRVDALPRAHLRVVGTDGKDDLDLRGHLDGVDLGDGADHVSLQPTGGVSGSFVGGPGRDLLEVQSPGLLADLERGRFGTHVARSSARIGGFEDLWVAATTAWLHGDSGPNSITADACSAHVRGGRGDDAIDSRGFGYGYCDEGPGPLGIWQYGGPGDDVLGGSTYPDHLIGGLGQDRANGRGAHDTCRAEHETECE